MRELSSSAFPLGETSLHLLHTPDGNMFVTADLAVKLFDSAPATFAEFVRANRYVRVNAMERAVVRLCASLGIPPETAGGDKPVPVVAAAVARDETVREDPNAKGGSANADAAGPKDAVTLLPEKTVLAILEDRRAPRRAAQFRETAARRSFVAAERLARQGAFADALPLALDAVRRAQDIHETPRARRMAAEAAEREARARRASSSGSPSGAKRNLRDETSVTNTGGTSAPHVALFEPYLLAASIALALGKTEACDSTLGLASWIALRRGDAVSETQRARLKRLRGELRSRQGRTRDALEEFASAAVHAAEASGPQTPRVALELFKLADAFRETRAEDLGPDGDEARGEARDDETETETETDAAANTAGSPHVNPTTTESALSASRCDAAATRIWLAAAADALGLLEESSAAAGAIAAFESRLKLTFSRQSRASFADLESGQLEEASQALGRVAAREAAGIGEGARDLAATASLARGLVLFVARERNVALLDASDAKDEDEGDRDRDEGESPDAPFAPTFEEAVARVAEAIAAFPPSSNGAAFARAALERWSGSES